MSAERIPPVGEQFTSREQQHEAARLGVWIFLATEVLFFGGMFAGYTAYRYTYPERFEQFSRELNWIFGTVNTVVLLTSSFTMALAVRAVQVGQRRFGALSALATAALGVVFLVIKALEYAEDIHKDLVPGKVSGSIHLLLSLYYAMTGLHAFHLLVGIGLLSWIFWLTLRSRVSPEYYTPVEMVGLYWHFVDVVWVFLYPLLYLGWRISS